MLCKYWSELTLSSTDFSLRFELYGRLIRNSHRYRFKQEPGSKMFSNRSIRIKKYSQHTSMATSMDPAVSSDSDVLYEVRNDTAWLTMNRPDVLNALSKGMFRNLERLIRSASTDASVRFVVIKGSGRAFSAGLDIREVSSLGTKQQARNFVYDLVKPFWERMFECVKPIISLVDGPAYGAGAEIVLCSDIAVASNNARFAFSGGRVGALCCISAGFGPLTSLGRKVVEMNLTGAGLSAEDARLAGLVNYVDPSEKLGGRVESLLTEMRHVSPISNASFKRIRRTAYVDGVMEVAHKELLKTITSIDFKKGATAFLEKTTPNY